jgi:hypothetical protein
MTSRPTTRSAAAEATVKDESLSETVKETVKEVAEAFTRQGLSGNSMPPIFTGETDAIDWLGIFERYARAGGWDDTTKVVKMDISMRGRGIRWLETATTPDDTWDQRRKSFIQYFKPADLLDQAAYAMCQQLEDEPTQLYIERFTRLADRVHSTQSEEEKTIILKSSSDYCHIYVI